MDFRFRSDSGARDYPAAMRSRAPGQAVSQEGGARGGNRGDCWFPPRSDPPRQRANTRRISGVMLPDSNTLVTCCPLRRWPVVAGVAFAPMSNAPLDYTSDNPEIAHRHGCTAPLCSGTWSHISRSARMHFLLDGT